MLDINVSTVMGNILLELAKNGKKEISLDDLCKYADLINKYLSNKEIPSLGYDCYSVSLWTQGIVTFAYSYAFMCDLIDDKLILKYEKGVPVVNKMYDYFRGPAPQVFIDAIKSVVK